MSLYSLLGFTAAAAVVSISVRSLSPALGRQTALAAACFALLTASAYIGGVVNEVREIALLGGVGGDSLSFALKAVGIAYITRAASSICIDAGEAALADAAELSGRLLLVILSLPVVKRIAVLLIDVVQSGF